jgi:phosphohistidine phosphatase
MKTVYLVRHAKSSWSDPGLTDQLRPLNERGLDNAPEMGRRLASRDILPNLIISSPAKRAITTASLLATEIGYPVDDILMNDQLYFDGAKAILNIIHQTKAENESLMLVAHNPDMTSLLNKLCGYQVDNMKTCAVAEIEFDLPWSGIQFNSGRLIEYDYPKKKS